MAELLPEILGDAPFREVTLRHEDQEYCIWMGQEVAAGQLISALQRMGASDVKLMTGDGTSLAAGDVPPDSMTMAGELVLQLRSCRVSCRGSSRPSRPPLSELLQLSTTGSSNEHVHAGLCTAYGPRISNQDSYICAADFGFGSATGGLFAVCDGHGGGSVSEALPPLLRQKLTALLAGKTDLVESVEAAFVEADEELRGTLEEAAERCGSTCAMCITCPQGNGLTRVILANLGDSRALLYRPRGDWEHLVSTKDHKPDLPCEKKRIRAAGGYVLPGDDRQPARLDAVLATSRAFGNFRFKDAAQTPGTRKVSPVPDVSILECRAGDVLVLATDGVWDVLSSSEVMALVLPALREGDPVEAAAEVIWASLQANTQDNVTCAVIQLG